MLLLWLPAKLACSRDEGYEALAHESLCNEVSRAAQMHLLRAFQSPPCSFCYPLKSGVLILSIF